MEIRADANVRMADRTLQHHGKKDVPLGTCALIDAAHAGGRGDFGQHVFVLRCRTKVIITRLRSIAVIGHINSAGIVSSVSDRG